MLFSFVFSNLPEAKNASDLWKFDSHSRTTVFLLYYLQLAAKGTDEVCMHVHIQFPFAASETRKTQEHTRSVPVLWGQITEFQIYVASRERR